MSLDSVINHRLYLWRGACSAWGFDDIRPPFTAAGQAMLEPGLVAFQAFKTIQVDGSPVRISLTVTETWIPGTEPDGFWKLEAEGCHLRVASWHLQVGQETGAPGAERLDVVPNADETHPKVHRHPYGEANDVRPEAELPPPEVWLQQADAATGGLIDDLKPWTPEAEEEY